MNARAVADVRPACGRASCHLVCWVVARVLMIGGGARGRALAAELAASGHAVRITTRTQGGRAAIEAAGAECWVGTPDRIASLRYALENVTIACWLLGTACGAPEQLRDLHGSRLEFFLGQTIDTTVRGLVYEAAGPVDAGVLAGGRALVHERAEHNAIPLAVLDADPRDARAWRAQALAAIDSLLARPGATQAGRYTSSGQNP